MSPLWFAWDGRALWLNSIVKSQRWTDLTRMRQAAVVIDAGVEFGELQGVELHGAIGVVGDVPRGSDPNPELEEPERLFGEKYAGGRFQPDGRHGWLRLVPDKVVSWDFRKLAVPTGAERIDVAPGRPLPALTAESSFFWTSGADGVLRFQRCARCGKLRHPYGPICAKCRSTDTELTEVRGTGTVLGVTVNHHRWLPDLDPPYVIAIVAIDEDPSVRLTTNIVGCDPYDVQVGQRVKVRFDKHEDVWLPLFEPTGEPRLREVRPDSNLRPTPRPMPRTDKFEEKVVLSGVGASRIGRRLMVNPLSLTVQACQRAVEDAGLSFDEIDGLSTYPGEDRYAGGHSEGGVSAVEEALRIRPTWINGAPETPGQTGSIVAAMLAVAAGLCRHVLCFRTVWESTSTARGAPLNAQPTRVDGVLGSFRFPFGAMSAANWIAMYASNYFSCFGTGRETLGQIAIAQRAHAALNPDAIYRDPMTMEDYLSARMISTPFGLLDCDVPCDGAIAVVVSAIDTAPDLRRSPVRIEAVGTQITERLSWDQETLTHEPQLAGPSAHLWSRSALKQADVDVALLYDGFTFNCLSWIEALGFCGIGEAAEFLDGGRAIALDGALPLNPHGGQLSAGRTHGYGFVREAMLQVRGEAAARQVQGAEVAVVTTGGGAPSGAFLITSW